MNCLRIISVSSSSSVGLCDARLILPRGLKGLFVGKSSVCVIAELYLFIQDSGLDHQIANHIEVSLARGERRIHDAVQRFRQRPTQERGLLVVVVAAYKIRSVFAVWFSLVQPK